MDAGIHRVAVVVDSAFSSEELSDLAEKMHVWLLETASNSASAKRFYEQSVSISGELLSDGVTLFSAKAKETPALRILEDILDVVSEHHNEYSLSPGWLEIHVYGVLLNDNLRSVLKDFGFSNVEAVSHEWIVASKSLSFSTG